MEIKGLCVGRGSGLCSQHLIPKTAWLLQVLVRGSDNRKLSRHITLANNYGFWASPSASFLVPGLPFLSLGTCSHVTSTIYLLLRLSSCSFLLLSSIVLTRHIVAMNNRKNHFLTADGVRVCRYSEIPGNCLKDQNLSCSSGLLTQSSRDVAFVSHL